MAWIYPGLLLVPKLLWLRLAARIAAINSFLILSIVFYLVITPVSLVMKLFGRDSMKRTLGDGQVSFLTPVSRQETAETLADQF